MGRGDKKTKKGKIFTGSYGVVRPRKAGQVITTEISDKKKKSQKETKAKKKSAKKK